MKLIIKWLLSAAALLLVAYLYSGVQVTSFTAALVAAFVIGLHGADVASLEDGAFRPLHRVALQRYHGVAHGGNGAHIARGLGHFLGADELLDVLPVEQRVLRPVTQFQPDIQIRNEGADGGGVIDGMPERLHGVRDRSVHRPGIDVYEPQARGQSFGRRCFPGPCGSVNRYDKRGLYQVCRS